jgi:uncharacterized lipoprotein YmbA
MIGPRLVLTLAAFLVLAAGCFGGGRAVVYYTLQASPLAPAMAASKPAEIGVGPVILPDYLDRSALVTRISPNQLNIHQGHYWAGSFQDEILRVVSENLKSACPGVAVLPHPWSGSDPPPVRFRLSILSFEGRPGGEVNLKVAWHVEDIRTGQAPLRRETHIRQSVMGDDFKAYAAAMGQALAGLTREMAKDVEVLAEASFDPD